MQGVHREAGDRHDQARSGTSRHDPAQDPAQDPDDRSGRGTKAAATTKIQKEFNGDTSSPQYSVSVFWRISALQTQTAVLALVGTRLTHLKKVSVEGLEARP